jgi:hypothetical protein
LQFLDLLAKPKEAEASSGELNMKTKRLLLAASTIVAAGLMSMEIAAAAGAFAMGRSTNGRVWYGSSANNYSIGQARQNALNSCYRHGNCQIVTTYWNKCFAFAWQVGRGRNGYGWATRDTARAAQFAAMAGCEQHGPACALQVTVCDTTGR